jgi:hypothetical protein
MTWLEHPFGHQILRQGWPKTVGVGFDADLVAVAGNPLDDINDRCKRPA